MHDLLERKPTLETSPKSSTRTRLARAALRIFEIVPRSPKPVVEKPKPVSETHIDLEDTGSHHLQDPRTDLTVGKLQADLAEAKWKEEFNTLLPKTPEGRKQVIYELAKDNPTILVAPEPEATSRVITFSSKDETLLNDVHKHKQR